MRHLRWGWSLSLVLLLACGGGTATQPTEEPMPDPTPEPEPEPEPEPAPEPEPEPEREPEPEPQPEPAEPPLVSPTSEQVHEAMLAASSDGHAFVRLVEPSWGVGVFDPAEDRVTQYCEMDNLANHPGLSFLIEHDDRFECDRSVRRCQVRDATGRGYAFVFREGEGGAVYLNAIVHYARRVPNQESRAARAFLQAGDGVCGLEHALSDDDPAPVDRFSVFVSEQTGLVPEVVSEHHCAAAANAAAEERLAVLGNSGPRRCDRNPARCEFRVGDEDVTVYGTDGVPSAVAITRHGMERNLQRAQDSALATFLRGADRHECSE